MQHTHILVHMLVDSEVVFASFVTKYSIKNLFWASVPLDVQLVLGLEDHCSEVPPHTLFCNTKAAYIPMDVH